MNIQSMNFLNRLKGCGAVNNELVVVEFNRLILNISKKLYQEGFIQSYKVFADPTAKNNAKQKIEINLRYYFDKPIFKKLKILSKPSQSHYMEYSQLAQISTKRDILFFSTTQGILTHNECKQRRIGGVLFFVCWVEIIVIKQHWLVNSLHFFCIGNGYACDTRTNILFVSLSDIALQKVRSSQRHTLSQTDDECNKHFIWSCISILYKDANITTLKKKECFTTNNTGNRWNMSR